MDRILHLSSHDDASLVIADRVGMVAAADTGPEVAGSGRTSNGFRHGAVASTRRPAGRGRHERREPPGVQDFRGCAKRPADRALRRGVTRGPATTTESGTAKREL